MELTGCCCSYCHPFHPVGNCIKAGQGWCHHTCMLMYRNVQRLFNIRNVVLSPTYSEYPSIGACNRTQHWGMAMGLQRKSGREELAGNRGFIRARTWLVLRTSV